jgi:cytochrome P450
MNSRPDSLFRFLFRFPGPNFYSLSRDPLGVLSRLAAKGEPVTRLLSPGENIYFVSDPELVKGVLVTNSAKFHKGRGVERLRTILGNGLLTSEGQVHHRQRQIIQPVFHHKSLKSYAEIMARHASRLTGSWGEALEINLTAEMARLTLMIVGEALFGADVEAETRKVGELMTAMMDSFPLRMSPLAPLFAACGHPKMRRGTKAQEELRGIVSQMINRRDRADLPREDLLALLFAARDAETGARMSNDQLQDEVMTILLAGHETTANALDWALYLLARHPGEAEKVGEELHRVLGPVLPKVEDLERLPVLERVVRESLRLYPPVWALGRRAIEDQELGNIRLRRRSIVVVSPWAMQRTERFFPDPEEFKPDRWTPAFRASLPKFAFFPFGGGPRQCIGDGFAWLELMVVLAHFLRDWRFELVPGQKIELRPAVTLRSKQPIRMRVRRCRQL